METIIIHSESKKIKAIVELLKVFDVSFEIKKAEKEYNPAFVSDVLESKQQYSKGKYTTIKTENLWK